MTIMRTWIFTCVLTVALWLLVPQWVTFGKPEAYTAEVAFMWSLLLLLLAFLPVLIIGTGLYVLVHGEATSVWQLRAMCAGFLLVCVVGQLCLFGYLFSS